jgi:adenine-specific DNA-methyltransferase
LGDVVAALDAELIIVSFNDEGYLSRDTLESMLRQRGEVEVIAQEYRRYIGAQIGVFSPRGERVGAVSHLRNQELLYIVRTPRFGDDARPQHIHSATALSTLETRVPLTDAG